MKPGRNDPCPCGSGRKYKHCHGAATAPVPASRADTATVLASAAADLRAGRLDAAAARLEHLLRTDPRHPDALLLRAAVAFRQQDYALAIERSTRLLEVRPTFAPAHFNLALCLDAPGRKAEAETRYREALRLDSIRGRAGAAVSGLAQPRRRPERARSP
ncbi:MAG: SEC-C metal-binding domain-containing protein [Burkholderiales bacterium]